MSDDVVVPLPTTESVERVRAGSALGRVLSGGSLVALCLDLLFSLVSKLRLAFCAVVRDVFAAKRDVGAQRNEWNGKGQ